MRERVGPLLGAWRGLEAAADSVSDLVSRGGGDVPRDWRNVLNLAALGLGVAGAAGVLRRLPSAYGAYAALSILLFASVPFSHEALASAPATCSSCSPCTCGGRSCCTTTAAPESPCRSPPPCSWFCSPLPLRPWRFVA